MSGYVDDLMGYVEWTPNRNVLVFRRTHPGRVFVRMRVFNRHGTQGYWYPSPRSFHVNQNCAERLGEALICAGRDETYCEPPEWWDEFEAQYETKGRLHVPKWKRTPAAR